MTTLVTGATGLVGNNVVRQLLQRSEPVRVLVRQQSDRRPLEGLDVEIVHGDIRDRKQVQDACEGVEVVIHSAGWVHIGWTGMELARAVNVDGSRNVAEAALSARARMVHVSSMNALGIGRRDRLATEESPRVGQVPCPYMITKRAAEEIVLDLVTKGLDAVVLNPSFMLGPWDWKPSSGRMVVEVARRFTPVAPRGGSSISDVRDVAAAVLAAVDRGVRGRRYLLTGQNMPYIELWRLIADVTGGRRPWIRIGPLASHVAGWVGDLISRTRGQELDINSAASRISNQYHYYSSARATAELGYRTRPPSESVRDAWQWFGEHGYV